MVPVPAANGSLGGETAAGCPALTLADLEGFDSHAPGSDGRRRFCCPLPACAGKPVDAQHRALVLETASGWWRCYRCGARGRLREHWPPRRSPRAAVRRAFALGSPPREDRPAAARSPAEAPCAIDGTAAAARARPVFDWRAAYAAAQPVTAGGADQHAAVYLVGRGIPPDLAAAAGVRATRAWYGRPAVLFPLHDQAGTLVAVAGRCIDGRAPKALTGGVLAPGLFATPGALTAAPLIVTEAPIDALSLAACGWAAVATCGTRWPAWLPRVCGFRWVVLATDADDAGDAAAAKLAMALGAVGARVERWRPAAGKDWNEVLVREGAARLRRALFDEVAGACYRQVRETVGAAGARRLPPPHPALEAAIDAADWPAFQRELAVYAAVMQWDG